MENTHENHFVMRTQKDNTMSFILQVVQEIEQGSLSNHQARSKIVGRLRKLVTLIGKIKHHQICQNLLNKK
jgi:hypothetical protein